MIKYTGVVAEGYALTESEYGSPCSIVEAIDSHHEITDNICNRKSNFADENYMIAVV